jgi:hypothetical protein
MASVNTSREELFANGFFKKHKGTSTLFVETGSGGGDGIDGALAAGFDKIVSVELSEKYYQYCKDKFINNSKVSLIFGDSRQILPAMLEENSNHSNMFIWLDAHFSEGGTTGDNVIKTLPTEIKAIVNHLKHHATKIVLAIDDLDTPTWAQASSLIQNYKVIEKETFAGVEDRFIIVIELGTQQ